MHRVRIITPARLHFSLIDLNGILGRIDGGFGLAIATPNFDIIAEPATSIQVASCQYQARALKILIRLQQTYPFPGIKLKFTSQIPMHSGFGSGTQLALGIAHAANVLYELGLAPWKSLRLSGAAGHLVSGLLHLDGWLYRRWGAPLP